jgi:polar amino acid transport system substrate-binding protein
MNKFSKKLFLAVITLVAISCPLSTWAQQSLKVAGQDIPRSGIYIDLINAIAKDAGLPQVQYQVMILADLIPAVTSGKIDVIATNMAITPERKQQVDFSNPIYTAPAEVVVVLATDKAGYKTLADLKGLPVGAQKGSIQLALLQRTGGFSEIKVYDTIQDAWAAVASGSIKAAVTPGGTTYAAAKQGQLPNLRIVSSYESSSPRPQQGIAVKKGNSALLGKINDSLAKLEAAGTVKAIFSKYGVDDWAPSK